MTNKVEKVYTLPIVGSRFHPPADDILEVIAIGTLLILRADPHNRFDENAIGIWIAKIDSPIKTTLRQPEYHLGFIPKDLAKVLRERGFPTDTDIPGEFYLKSDSNQPHIRFQL
jgi:hypothetical protein